MADEVTLRQLRCIAVVADTLHFGNAADECGISQPALSAQISKLEATLGVQLVERTTRRVGLTANGGRVVEHARKVLDEVHGLIESANEMSRPLTGPLHFGVIPTVAPYLLPPVLSRARTKHPQLQLMLHEEQTASLLDGLRTSRIDIAILALPVDSPGLEVIELGKESFQLVVCSDHRLASRKTVQHSDLAEEEVLLLEDGHCLRDQALEVCSLAGATETARVRANSISTLVQMVANGLGVTLLPVSAVTAELRGTRDVKAIPFRSHVPTRTLGLVTRTSFHRSADLDLLAEMFRRRI